MVGLRVLRACSFGCALLLSLVTGCGDDSETVRFDSGGVDSSEPDGGGMCTAGETMCGGGCVDTSRDQNHCGGCGQSCQTDEACVSGSCQMMMMCDAGMADCGAGCMDVTSDNQNCGSCGRSCQAGESCMNGVCAAAMCQGNEMRCGAACVDTMTDDANCGTCGMECPAGQSCTMGTCASSCTAPNMVCGMGDDAACVNTMTDEANCGMCGMACPSGQVCTNGSCGCAMDEMMCGDACVDTDTDTNNCGMCGNACPMGQNCMGGMCECPAPTTLCNGTCTITNIDSQNCGMCGNVCPVATPACVMGGCMASSCPGMQIPCGATCADPTSDDMNCGGCGMACGMGTSCVTSVCRPDNDLRMNAAPLMVGTSEVTITGSTTGATKDGPASGSECFGCASSGNVWYSITLSESGVLYLDTQGSSYDTKLFVTDSTGAALTSSGGEVWCQDDHSCGSATGWGRRDARVYGHLTAGTYLVSVGGCGTGNFTLHAQFMPASIASFFYTTALSGTGVTSNTGLIGTSTNAGLCGGTSSGEDARWFVTCGGQPQVFSLCRSDSIGIITRTRPEYERTDGTTNFDPRVYMRSAQTGTEVVCNDDGAAMGATDCRGYNSDASGNPLVDGFEYGSRINGVVAPRGVGAVFIDSSGGSGMNYRLLHRVRDAP